MGGGGGKTDAGEGGEEARVPGEEEWSCGCRAQARDGEPGAAGVEETVEARERRESDEEAREARGEDGATSDQLQRVS